MIYNKNYNILKKFYKNKQILITGATGFKGSWLSLIMLNSGAKVKGFSLIPEKDKSLYTKLKLEDNSNNIYGDIRNEKLLTNELVLFKPVINSEKKGRSVDLTLFS